jgi:serine/threonine protein kinase
MDAASPRWQGIRSTFSWEQDALQHIKAQVPDAEPHRARQIFTFTAKSGHVREVDLFMATPGGIFLVEIKSHPGRATNNGATWVFADNGIRRTVENPLHFTDAKAKELKELLVAAAKQLGIREPVPRIEAGVFLSAENLRCDFDDFQRPRVFGRDGLEDQTTLPGIWHGFLNQPPRSERDRVTPTFAKQIPKLLQHVGIRDLRKLGKVGPYELEPRSYTTGPTWEDYLAHNPAMPNDAPRRVRVFLSERTATDRERESTTRAARREYQALQGISHDGIVRAEQFSNELFIGPSVVFAHGKDWQRLDQFMVAPPFELPLETRLEMIGQLADALAHAHRRHLYHRALAARAVYVELDGRYPRLHIADWQVAVRPGGSTPPTATALATPTSLAAHLERGVGPYLAPEFANPDADPARLDVFGLGALSYLVLTGQAPAATRERLAERLQSERALAPSAIIDSIGPSVDALVRDATAVSPADRTESVRGFIQDLEAVEEELTAPSRAPATDPLAAGRGDEINGWTVVRVLGKGSTSKALLVRKDSHDDRVYKVALNGAAARRLRREAEQLSQLNDSHVARLLDPPFEYGPPGQDRTIVGVEYVGDHTLADELRRHGPLTIHELERLGEDLFQALKFLDGREIWHRDIKPDNLALRRLERKGRELVLFDFSLAGTKDTELEVGTKDYLDPFLGSGRRDRYDQAAELYAVAVTLHEMASGELPSWGDGLVPLNVLKPDEEVQLAEDIFDPVIRDGLVEFFRKALDRDAKRRYGSLRAMTRAWMDIYHDVKTQPPFTTASTVDDDSDDVRKARENAQQKATMNTPLAAAGLSPFALSISQQKLGVSTAGELARVPAKRIAKLRGIGSEPRYELIRLSRDWRERFRLPETQLKDKPGNHLTAEAASDGDADSPAAQTPLSVDAVVRRLVPDSPPELWRVVGLIPVAGTGTLPVSPWADQREIARLTGMADQEVAGHLDRLRNRWTKSVPELTQVREDVAAILREHGRILGWKQLAVGLLTRRGSELGDSEARLTQAAICVRAAVETEERLDTPRLVAQRITGDGVLIAAPGDPLPSAGDLFAYAELLGAAADALSARNPLPGSSEIKNTLRAVPTADHAARLSDIDLVLLGAAASRNAGATARLELYPLDLPPERALKISQVGSFVGGPGMDGAELARRVLARFPDLVNPPKPEDIGRLLRQLGYEVTRGSDGRLHALSATQLSMGTATAKPRRSTATRLGFDQETYARERLDGSRRHGGFLAVKTRIGDLPGTLAELVRKDGVTPVNVSADFVRLLREAWTEQARPPRWESVLLADSDNAPPAAKVGFARLLDTTWTRLDAHIRAIGSGIVLLHDATPLARYTGGLDLLAKVAVAARQSGESPYGLWLLCPMGDPEGLPLLDDKPVGVIPGDAEQLVVPDGFGATKRRAS